MGEGALAQLVLGLLILVAAATVATAQTGPTTPYPILFVTQVPLGADFASLVSAFANHKGDPSSAPRGGDLWIRYENGTLRNLTAAAGFGSTAPNGLQDANVIAVRDPAVDWSGTKAVFSMVVGAPAHFQVKLYLLAGTCGRTTFNHFFP